MSEESEALRPVDDNDNDSVGTLYVLNLRTVRTSRS